MRNGSVGTVQTRPLKDALARVYSMQNRSAVAWILLTRRACGGRVLAAL